MRYGFIAVVLAFSMFFCMLLFLELGRRIGVHRFDKPGARAGVGVVDGTVYALTALLLGFAFNGAASRFDARRGYVADASNSAGTAWQRLDMLPAASQPEIRANFRQYIDVLIASYEKRSSAIDALREPPELTAAGNRLWASAVAVCITPEGEKARMLVLPSLNEMFGAVEKERVARRIHPPAIIFILLAISALSGALFVGYALANGHTRNWIYMIGVAATISAAIYVIVELEFPRLGVVRIDSIDNVLVELRSTMK